MFIGREFHWLEPEAQAFAENLNIYYALRTEQPDKDGRCMVCGDYHGEPPGALET